MLQPSGILSAAAALALAAAALLLQGCEELPDPVHHTTSTRTTTTTTTRTTTSSTTTTIEDNATSTATSTTETSTSSTQKCSGDREDCRSTLCCKDEAQQCYRKNQAYFACKDSCSPREVDPEEPEWDQFPWECTIAEKMSEEWVNGTFTTGYWDCCRPSCAWLGKGNVDNPVRTCRAVSGSTLVGNNAWAGNVCFGGQAAACVDHQPWVVPGYPRLSMGFAAAAVSGNHGLNGDENCGQCFLLRFTGEQHSYGRGAHPDLVGKAMIVQVTNIGYDVTGDHAFDIQIPSAGRGQFEDGCATQFPGDDSLDFDCGTEYGGCSTAAGCELLPVQLRPGCEWRYSWYKWNISTVGTDNPFVQFKRVRCPDELLQKSYSQPLDDELFQAVDFSEYA